MEINLNGNILTNGYFAGIVLGDNAISKWVVISSTYSALAGDKIQTDISGASLNITFPATIPYRVPAEAFILRSEGTVRCRAYLSAGKDRSPVIP